LGGGVDWPLCVPQPWREIDAHGPNAKTALSSDIIENSCIPQSYKQN